MLQLVRKIGATIEKVHQNTHGISVVEVIVAIGIFVIITGKVIALVIGNYNSLLRERETLQANMYLQQGIEAVRSIRNHDFEDLTVGTYGLTKVNDYWELNGNSDTQGQYTRTIEITNVNRDQDCDLVTEGGGGELDESTKQITATITWLLEDSLPLTITNTQYLTDWESPTNCGSEAAENVTFDISDYDLFGGDRKIRDIYITNDGPAEVKIDKVVVDWFGLADATKVEKIKIEGTTVWNQDGNPGETLDVDDFVIDAGATVEITELEFDDDILAATMNITLIFTDGSSKSTGNFLISD